MNDNSETMPSDHDILLDFRASMTEKVGNLKDSQDNFHTEIRKSFADLQTNYTGKIDKNSADIDRLFMERVARKDFECLQSDVEKLKGWRNIIVGGMGVIIFAITFFSNFFSGWFNK